MRRGCALGDCPEDCPGDLNVGADGEGIADCAQFVFYQADLYPYLKPTSRIRIIGEALRAAGSSQPCCIP